MMRKNNHTKGKLGLLKKGALCAAFAIIASSLSSVGVGYTPSCLPEAPQSSPDVVYVFGEEASAQLPCHDSFDVRWQRALYNQEHLYDDTESAAQYREFLSGFDDLRDLPIRAQAYEVTLRVNAMLDYKKDNPGGKNGDHWQDALTTFEEGAGDCEDYAIAKYFVLRYLGVAADRLYIATVGTGDHPQGVNHAVLLVNIAQEGHQNDPGNGVDYRVLDMYRNFLPTNISSFTPFGLRNENGFWEPDPATHAPPADAAQAANMRATSPQLAI